MAQKNKNIALKALAVTDKSFVRRQGVSKDGKSYDITNVIVSCSATPNGRGMITLNTKRSIFPFTGKNGKQYANVVLKWGKDGEIPVQFEDGTNADGTKRYGTVKVLASQLVAEREAEFEAYKAAHPLQAQAAAPAES